MKDAFVAGRVCLFVGDKLFLQTTGSLYAQNADGPHLGKAQNRISSVEGKNKYSSALHDYSLKSPFYARKEGMKRVETTCFLRQNYRRSVEKYSTNAIDLYHERGRAVSQARQT